MQRNEDSYAMIHRVEISRSALLHNVALFRHIAPQSLMMAVVKSNAYGHGLEAVVGELAGRVDWFGVNSFAEACRVRAIDAQTPILVMGLNGSEIGEILAEETMQPRAIRQRAAQAGAMQPGAIHFVAAGEESLRGISAALRSSRKRRHIALHLKVDSGLSRLGVQGSALQRDLRFLAEDRHIQLAGLMTHFANVEDVTDQRFALQQLGRFQEACDMGCRLLGPETFSKLLRHTAASAAALLLPAARLDMIRIGIALYGLWPSPLTRLSLLAPRQGGESSRGESSRGESSQGGQKPLELRPVLRWLTRVAHLQEIAAGSFVGYGCADQVGSRTKIAVLPVGYYEGYQRMLSSRSYILIRGKRAPLLGRVSMNMITVDVTGIAGVSVGDEAVLIGSMGAEGAEVSADHLAQAAGAINYEIVSGISEHIPRVLVE